MRLGARELSPKRRERGGSSVYRRRDAESALLGDTADVAFGAKPRGATKYPWADLRLRTKSDDVALTTRHQMHMGRTSGARPLRQVARLSRRRPTQPGRRHQIPMGLTCGDAPPGAPGHTRAPPNTHRLRSERRRRADGW